MSIVIGGGFFGCSLALFLAERGDEVVLLERGGELLGRASLNNQARVHSGYHYPRSILTGLRSRVNCSRFLADFADCVDRGFRHYYAVARKRSNVTARQFETFCQRIEAPLKRAPPFVRAWFDEDLVEEVYEVEEFAFDAIRLRAAMTRRLADARVQVRLRTRALSVSPGGLRVEGEGGAEMLRGSPVFNCTYSALNELLERSGLDLITLRHELTEMLLIEPPQELRRAAVTVMCGPFFSTMPFPAAGLHSFSHVRYTPHVSWEERGHAVPPPAETPQSHAVHMLKDAQRYLPLLSRARVVRSFYEVKTILPQCEGDDSRPILFKRSERLPDLISVMGGKIDNVYDLPRELSLLN